MSSSDDYSQYMDKQSKCSKPPISICLEGCTFYRSTAQPSELHPAAHAARPSYGESPSLRSEMERDLHTDGGNKHPVTKLPDFFGCEQKGELTCFEPNRYRNKSSRHVVSGKGLYPEGAHILSGKGSAYGRQSPWCLLVPTVNDHCKILPPQKK
jgi:hypothetical protein